MKRVFLLTNIYLESTICEESLGYRNEQDKQSQFSHHSHSSGSISPPNYTSDSQMVIKVYAEKQGRCQEAEWLTQKGSRTQGFEDWTDFGFCSKWDGWGIMWLIWVGSLWLLCWKQVVKAWRSVKRQIYIYKKKKKTKEDLVWLLVAILEVVRTDSILDRFLKNVFS